MLLLMFFLAALYVIGRGLPAEHRLACTLQLRQPQQLVFDTIADIARWPTWDFGVTKVEADSSNGTEFVGRMFMGRNLMGVTARRVDPPRVPEIRVEDLGARIFSDQWRHEIKPTADGCSVALIEDGTIRAALPRALARTLFDPAVYLKRHLRMLAATFCEVPRLS